VAPAAANVSANGRRRSLDELESDARENISKLEDGVLCNGIEIMVAIDLTS